MQGLCRAELLLKAVLEEGVMWELIQGSTSVKVSLSSSSQLNYHVCRARKMLSTLLSFKSNETVFLYTILIITSQNLSQEISKLDRQFSVI